MNFYFNFVIFFNLFLFLFLFFCLIEAERMQIVIGPGDEAGLTNDVPQNGQVAMQWPLEGGYSHQCSWYLDLQKVHEGKYSLKEWSYTEQPLGVFGSIATRFSIYDMEQFVKYAAEENVWSERNCDHTSSVMLAVVKRVIDQLSFEKKKMLIRYMGLEVSVLCRENGKEYDICSPTQLYEMTHSTYKSNRKHIAEQEGRVLKNMFSNKL